MARAPPEVRLSPQNGENPPGIFSYIHTCIHTYIHTYIYIYIYIYIIHIYHIYIYIICIYIYIYHTYINHIIYISYIYIYHIYIYIYHIIYIYIIYIYIIYIYISYISSSHFIWGWVFSLGQWKWKVVVGRSDGFACDCVLVEFFPYHDVSSVQQLKTIKPCWCLVLKCRFQVFSIVFWFLTTANFFAPKALSLTELDAIVHGLEVKKLSERSHLGSRNTKNMWIDDRLAQHETHSLFVEIYFLGWVCKTTSTHSLASFKATRLPDRTVVECYWDFRGASHIYTASMCSNKQETER